MKCGNDNHKICCKKIAKHGECCKEWAFPGFIGLALISLSLFFPGTFGLVIAVITTPIGLGVIMTLVTGLAVRKNQVRSWEIDRPFNDGDDATPDPYLFNPGPGATWGLRAFMPDVEVYSFWKQPVSWCVKQAKRKVAIVLDDGSVSFTWFPVAWISAASGGGSRIEVPEGYRLPAEMLVELQLRRDEYKDIPWIKRTQYQNDYLLFTDEIFKAHSRFDVSPATAGELIQGLAVESLPGCEIMPDVLRAVEATAKTANQFLDLAASKESVDRLAGQCDELKIIIAQIRRSVEEQNSPQQRGALTKHILAAVEERFPPCSCKSDQPSTKAPGATKVKAKKSGAKK